jgi:hypothetical protein
MAARAFRRFIELTQRTHLLELGIAFGANIFVNGHFYSPKYSLTRLSLTFKMKDRTGR